MFHFKILTRFKSKKNKKINAKTFVGREPIPFKVLRDVFEIIFSIVPLKDALCFVKFLTFAQTILYGKRFISRSG
jgi:hypothetical protein